MHIPDGYLSPQTYVPLYGASVAIWSVALRKLKKDLSVKQVPYLSMAAAFSFLIMMFNIPIPGGTTGHAVGGAIIAILLGPWTAVVAVSVVLIIQAIVFGDGGVTAIGANCFNMAVVMPFVSYWVFRLAKGRSTGRGRLYISAFLSGYAGLVASAVFAGIEFGIQPMIAVAPDGAPLYAPYPLSIALPAMALGHMLFLGPVEGLITMLLAGYFFEDVTVHARGPATPAMAKSRKALWIGIGILALLTPLGILLPRFLNAGAAWGEWGPEELKKLVGFVPEGIRKLGELWKAPLPDYGFGGGGPASETVSYMISGLVGLAVTVAAVYLVSKVLMGKGLKGSKVRTSFVDKGLHHVANVIKTTYIQWETASRKGLLQGLDARVKVLFLAVFLIAVSLKKDVTSELLIAAFVLILAAASRVGFVSYYKRVLFLGFFFGFLVALPASLNIVTNGTVVVPVITLPRAYEFWVYHIPMHIGVTSEGMRGVALLTMRVINSVSLSLLVLYTTPFHEVIKALKMLRVPDTFLMVINLTYKYIFIFAKTVEDMHLAKKSRMVGDTSDSDARKWVAGRIALVFKKTQLRCEDIFRAMVSRGFSGEVKMYGFRKLAAKDYIAGFLFLTAGVAAIWM
jgi:cobalt ECF transporter T component CbiQ/cobalamin biosynthesis protein CbiM